MTNRHQSIQATISYGGGFGFLYGMFLPVGLMQLGVDLITVDTNLGVVLLLLVGSPFACMLLAIWLFRKGVRAFGRPAMSYVNTAMLFTVIAVVGWFAGLVYIGLGSLGGIAGALCLVVPNALLFYSRRDYLYGEGLISSEDLE